MSVVSELNVSPIRGVIRRARFRMRMQWALEGAATATILAAATALVAIFLIRLEVVSVTTGIGVLIGAGALVVIGAIIAASRRVDDEVVARRIDRASSLSDRLSTAIAFHRSLATGVISEDHATTEDLMVAAIGDGIRAVPRANISASAPYAVPKDTRAALLFVAISALAAGLALPMPDRSPKLFAVDPDHARPGEEVMLTGENLLIGVATPVASISDGAGGMVGTPQVVEHAHHGFVPADAKIMLGANDAARPVRILDWTTKAIWIEIPANAPIGPTVISAVIDGKQVGPLEFLVVDPHDTRYFSEKAVVLDPDEREMVERLLAQLKEVAKTDNVDDLDKFAKQIEKLLNDAQEGKITKEQLLEALQKAEDALNKNPEPEPEQVQKDMQKMGKELEKDKLTKDLGEALEKNDLDKAKKELEKLADKLDKKELDDKQKEELGKQLDKVSKEMDKQDKDKKDQEQKQEQKVADQIRRLEKEKKEAKNDKERADAERRLDQKKDELKKLQKDEQDKQNSEQRQALKRLQRDMGKAAENLQKPEKKDGQQQDQQEQQQRDQQASQKLKDAARETGRVDQDQRKQAAQKKTTSQMEELREAMRRAKQKGNKGPGDPFNKQGKNQDFISRAKGGKGQGQGQAWKPGQGQQPGQGQGQGQGQQGQGQGQDPGGQKWGVGHDPNMTGDATSKTGNDKDAELQGKQSDKGSSTRETILAAAQKGFASTGYKKVFVTYEKAIEDVMRNEKLPSSYKYYVKRYFAKIHPSMSEQDAPDTKATP